ncbi:MAG: hypothetical protein K2O15_02230 [Lachnospiraceae bacterium]|nr:hypothetical protein [Lachnospiraceae bacterium]
MSAPILFDQSKLKAYDGLMRLCGFAGKTEQWQQSMWCELLTNRKLYDAFVYYLEHHGLPDFPKCGEYSLTDCYVWQIEQDNLRKDTGKNTADCNKEDMVLQSFMMMAKMLRDPETYAKKLSDWKGMDQTM